MENNKDYSKAIFTLLFIITIAIGFFALKALHSFILPVIFAIFLSFACLPIVIKITNKTKLPWTIVSVFVLVIFIIFISFIVSLLSLGVQAVINEFPEYQVRFKNIIYDLIDLLPVNYDYSKSLFENFESTFNVPGLIQNIAVPFTTGVVTFIKSLFIVLILSLFLIVEAKGTSDKIRTVFVKHNKTSVLKMSKTIISEVVRYISIKFFISFATGVFVYFGTLILGLKFPIIWAFIAFIFNFIPTFGSLFSVLITTLFAIIQFAPHWQNVIYILVLMGLVNFLIGNIIEPKIEGENLGLSTFVIIVCILFWGWLWGFTGMILAVPLTVIIKIICENIEFLHPIAIFLSNDAKKARAKLQKIK